MTDKDSAIDTWTLTFSHFTISYAESFGRVVDTVWGGKVVYTDPDGITHLVPSTDPGPVTEP